MCIMSVQMILVGVSNVANWNLFKCSFMLKVFGYGCAWGG
jgi:hypothetical protein